MASIMVMQGRKLDEADIGMIRGLMATHPGWNRTRLSREYPLVPTINTS